MVSNDSKKYGLSLRNSKQISTMEVMANLSELVGYMVDCYSRAQSTSVNERCFENECSRHN